MIFPIISKIPAFLDEKKTPQTQRPSRTSYQLLKKALKAFYQELHETAFVAKGSANSGAF